MMAAPGKTSRRAFLATAATAAAGVALGAASQPAAPAVPGELRIGAILPIGGEAMPITRANLSAVGEAARKGLVLAEEDQGRNAEVLGRGLHIVLSNAPGPQSAARAAARLIARDRVSAIIGGFDRDEAEALAEVAEDAGVLFLNVGASSDALRQTCRRHTFHIEASAAMYLDAVMGWFVRAGFRNWHIVHSAGSEGEALLARALAALGERHWGAREVGRSVVSAGAQDFEAPIRHVEASAPDIVLLLVDWLGQLDFLARYEAAGLPHAVTGLPEAATQLRDYFATARQAAPGAGTGHRAVLWEATLDAYGARELNARFASRWGRPMDPPAWAAYQAIKIAFEASLFAGAADGGALADYLTTEAAVFDVHKGIGVSFRPWDHQLRQSLYLVKINPSTESGHGLRPVLARASLVGELPAIYMPGTDPIERLDQLGDKTGACA